jgi:hypothetical protein
VSKPEGEWANENGAAHAALANSVSDAIVASGLDVDVAVCVVAAVAADYARMDLGDGYLPQLAEVVLTRAEFELPEYTPLPKGMN